MEPIAPAIQASSLRPPSSGDRGVATIERRLRKVYGTAVQLIVTPLLLRRSAP